MSYPTVNHTTCYNPITNEYEVKIDIKFKNVATSTVVPTFGLSTEPIKPLTKDDIAKLKPVDGLQAILDKYTKPNSATQSGMSSLSSLINSPKTNSGEYTNPWDDNGHAPYLCGDVIETYKPITRNGIQSIINSLEALKKSCIL